VLTDTQPPPPRGWTYEQAVEAAGGPWPEGATDWIPGEGFIYGGTDVLAPWEIAYGVRAGYSVLRAAGGYAFGADAATAAGGGVASQGIIATRGFRFFFGRGGILNSNQYLRVGLGRDAGNLVFRASGRVVERITESGHIIFKTFGKF
jgi:hypothetical protein